MLIFTIYLLPIMSLISVDYSSTCTFCTWSESGDWWMTYWDVLPHPIKGYRMFTCSCRPSLEIIDSSHKCSLEFKSGFKAGQCMTFTFFCSRKSLGNLAVCARALSCWKVWFWCWAKCCTKLGWRTLSCIGQLLHHCLHLDRYFKRQQVPVF